MLTRRGICYNLHNSPYVFKTADVDFHFSSALYFEKFAEEYRANRQAISESLTNRFSLEIEFNNVADIVLYSKIEKRGFYIVFKGVVFRCKENLILYGEKVNRKN